MTVPMQAALIVEVAAAIAIGVVVGMAFCAAVAFAYAGIARRIEDKVPN